MNQRDNETIIMSYEGIARLDSGGARWNQVP